MGSFPSKSLATCPPASPRPSAAALASLPTLSLLEILDGWAALARLYSLRFRAWRVIDAA
jgi:hypothetical protein